ncbi:hypothetical protein Nepgr_025738 [Nepenthes gracilis]|uniref:Uncharacterized protein n=1 Tax=Nepenthes gracilis TaxID=150966 RepID=A0AAD3Y1E7_NEPGR|nr:hypothetical protein Nepgr_025738 [Nepenthes gracilis]
MPVWSLRLRKVRPPWSRCKATHPQSRTQLPTSASDNSPQNAVRRTHLRLSLLDNCGFLWSEMRDSVEELGVAEETQRLQSAVCKTASGLDFGKVRW